MSISLEFERSTGDAIVAEAQSDEKLESFFSPGVELGDIESLHPMLQAREQLAAFGSLFRGSESGSIMKFFILQEIARRTEPPSWEPGELRNHFSFLELDRFEAVLSTLKRSGLLFFDQDQRYHVSPLGRACLSSVLTLLRFANEESGDLALLTAQIAGAQEVGGLQPEHLQHMLSRLNELQEKFNEAILSGSEVRIRTAEQQLQSAWKWIAKSSEVIRGLMNQGTLTDASYRLAQAIGRSQSRLLQMTSVFQRALNNLEKQKIHLGQSGLSSSDMVRWLQAVDPVKLGGIFDSTPITLIQVPLLSGDTVADIAEFEMFEREKIVESNCPLPTPRESDETTDIEDDQLLELGAWIEWLRTLSDTTTFLDLAKGSTYSKFSYQFSLLTLLGDPLGDGAEEWMKKLATLPFELQVTDAVQDVDHKEIDLLSDGHLNRKLESL